MNQLVMSPRIKKLKEKMLSIKDMRQLNKHL